jgi:hypothetical protein
MVRRGLVGQGKAVEVWSGGEWCGEVGVVWQGGPGLVRRGQVRHGLARLGGARRSRLGRVRHGLVWSGEAV